MRTSTAYFAGVGTVIAAVVAGLGGGYLAANIAHPPVHAVSKLERRMSAEPIQVSAAPAGPATAPLAASAPPKETPPAQPEPPQSTEAAAPSTSAAPSPINGQTEEKTSSTVTAAQPVQQPQLARSAEQADERTAAPRDSYAKARDGDVKRADAEKRRAERRQRWADQRNLRQPREQELEAVEQVVRQETEPRRIRIREEAEPRGLLAERARTDMPRIRLFDQD